MDELTHTAFLAFGSNLENKQANIARAVELLNALETVQVVILSKLYETEPEGFVSKNSFFNAAAKIMTSLLPLELLHVTQQIERRMGRKVKSANGVYADRIIDIDILLYDDLCLATPELTVPHPRMYERPFVMRPLEDILNALR
jgi:2-amino-4-hydroxy-6-hydroxymethyldihydropteridine diphosphokinase